MAIQFTHTDPQTNTSYPLCYARIEGADIAQNSWVASVRVALYKDKATRDSRSPTYRPFDVLHVRVVNVIDYLDVRGDKLLWDRVFVDSRANNFVGNPTARLYMAIKAANAALGAGVDV